MTIPPLKWEEATRKTEEFSRKRKAKIAARTYEQDIERLQELAANDDPETEHSEADEIIIKYIPQEMRELWEKVYKWYS